MTHYTTIPTARLTRDEWRRLRQRGLGGSDAAHIVLPRDDYRYADPAKIFRYKVEPI